MRMRFVQVLADSSSLCWKLLRELQIYHCPLMSFFQGEGTERLLVKGKKPGQVSILVDSIEAHIC